MYPRPQGHVQIRGPPWLARLSLTSLPASCHLFSPTVSAPAHQLTSWFPNTPPWVLILTLPVSLMILPSIQPEVPLVHFPGTLPEWDSRREGSWPSCPNCSDFYHSLFFLALITCWLLCISSLSLPPKYWRKTHDTVFSAKCIVHIMVSRHVAKLGGESESNFTSNALPIPLTGNNESKWGM